MIITAQHKQSDIMAHKTNNNNKAIHFVETECIVEKCWTFLDQQCPKSVL